MKDLMTDLETLGTVPGCSILSIGAVFFDHNGLGEEFYMVASRKSCKKLKLHEDPGTLKWWEGQSEEARKVLTAAGAKDAPPLDYVLSKFNEFVKARCPGVKVWGCGADFDNAILQVAYRAAGMHPAWAFTNNRCYRTLKGFSSDLKIVREGTYHNALSDAQNQARHAIQVLQRHPTLRL